MAKIGLIEPSEIKEKLVKVDSNTIIKYSIKEEKIDIGALEIEKKGIEEQLAKVLSDQELLEWAKKNYPYQGADVAVLNKRLEEINSLLAIK